MKTYEFVQDEFEPRVLMTQGETVSVIPLDPANSDYAEYLRYTEWVEAGNDPDEFWSQSEDFLTLSESNETEAI